jgi:hypothetical protein
VNKAVLELIADNKSKTYGQDNPVLTFSVVGLTNGDTKGLGVDRGPDAGHHGGQGFTADSYPITITGGPRRTTP